MRTHPHKNLTEMIEEITREIDTRVRVYPRWIDEGKITREEAEHRYMCCRSILLLLNKEQAKRVGVQTDFFDKTNNPFTPLKEDDENTNADTV